jgi:hypothetical protein
MDDILNVLTVKVGKAYSSDYVNKMYSALRRNLHLPFDFYCLTDDDEGLDEDITALTPPFLFNGWWNKLFLFSGYIPQGKLLYMDLDQVVTGDITEIVRLGLEHRFASYADHIEWLGVKFGSAMMIFDPYDFRYVWGVFYSDREQVMREYAEGGDQVYLSRVIDSPFYLDEAFPGAIQSYKWGLKGKPPSPDVKIVNFHGKPKPHQLKEPWVSKHWR